MIKSPGAEYADHGLGVVFVDQEPLGLRIYLIVFSFVKTTAAD